MEIDKIYNEDCIETMKHKMYDREEMLRLLEWLFSFFEKEGKAKRAALKRK